MASCTSLLLRVRDLLPLAVGPRVEDPNRHFETARKPQRPGVEEPDAVRVEVRCVRLTENRDDRRAAQSEIEERGALPRDAIRERLPHEVTVGSPDRAAQVLLAAPVGRKAALMQSARCCQHGSARDLTLKRHPLSAPAIRFDDLLVRPIREVRYELPTRKWKGLVEAAPRVLQKTRPVRLEGTGVRSQFVRPAPSDRHADWGYIPL
jgi:hypothetical protein